MSFARIAVGLGLASALCGLALAQDLEQNLIAAAWSGQLAAVRSLLDTGRVDVNAADEKGNTALMLASLAGHEGVVRMLLEAGADPNRKNEDGETALVLAAKYGWTSVAAALIEAGADARAADVAGRTAWTWARWGENATLESLLEAAGAGGSGRTDPFEGDVPPIERFEEPPRLEKGKAPKLPRELLRTGRWGDVVLRVVVDRRGKPVAVELAEGLDEGLDAAILKAAKKWRFEPGTIQGRPVLGVVTVRLEYRPAGKGEGRIWIVAPRWRG